MPSKRTRNVVVAAAIVAAIAGSAFMASAAQSRAHENITLTVDVFGDFGYKDPGVTAYDAHQRARHLRQLPPAGHALRLCTRRSTDW